eukprot:scaffold287_cov337-Pavlova_lutheri.AAC.167
MLTNTRKARQLLEAAKRTWKILRGDTVRGRPSRKLFGKKSELLTGTAWRTTAGRDQRWEGQRTSRNGQTGTAQEEQGHCRGIELGTLPGKELPPCAIRWSREIALCECLD